MCEVSDLSGSLAVCQDTSKGILMKQAEPQVASVMKLCNDNKDVAFGPCLVTFALLSLQRHAVPTASPTPQVLYSSLPCQWVVLRRARLSLPIWGFSLTCRGSRENSLQAATKTLSLSLLPGLGVIICKLIQIGDPSQSGVKEMCFQSSKMYLRGKGIICSMYTTEKAST